MRFINAKLISVTASLLLGLSFVDSASAVSVSEANLDGIAPAGNPNFTFEIDDSDYSNTIESWFSNTLYIESQGKNNGYKLFAAQEGDFTYWQDPNTAHAGTSGVFNLYAEFDKNGNLIFGMMAISGKVAGIGITDPDTVLMRADLIAGDFATKKNVMGFGIDINYCDGKIVNDCQMVTPESVYFFTDSNLPSIQSLGDSTYQTPLASISTRPGPASIWLMLSALSLAGVMARRKKQAV
jgi:hypothetical protein